MATIDMLRPSRFEAKTSPSLMLQPPDVVVYAGSSLRRTAFIQQAFPTQNLHNVFIGPEPDSDVAEVARHKINVVYERGVPKNTCTAIIAADTHTVTAAYNEEHDIIQLVSRGKPGDAKEVRLAFQQMTRVSDMRNEPPFYQVDSASAMLHLNGSAHLVEDRETCLVTLNAERLRWLGQEGFPYYLEAFINFYSQPPYSTSAMEVGITDLSAGFSLPVLVKMGLVTSVNGVSREDEGFRDAFQFGIHTAAIGVSPHILNTVQVKGKDAIRNWPWLIGVVDSALSS